MKEMIERIVWEQAFTLFELMVGALIVFLIALVFGAYLGNQSALQQTIECPDISRHLW